MNNKNTILIIIVLVLILLGAWFFYFRNPTTPSLNGNGQIPVRNDNGSSMGDTNSTGSTGGTSGTNSTGTNGSTGSTNVTGSTGVNGTINTNITTTVSTTKSFNVTGANFRFNPAEIRVNKGDTVKITFDSVGGTHDFKIDEFNAGTNVLRDSDAPQTIQFVADKTGTFEYYCSVGNHRQMGMVGKLIVQ